MKQPLLSTLLIIIFAGFFGLLVQLVPDKRLQDNQELLENKIYALQSQCNELQKKIAKLEKKCTD